MNNKGFTLIEIIIVIVILGIMAALALPKITESVNKGRMPAALEGLGKIQRELDMCFQMASDFGDCDTLQELGYAAGAIDNVSGWAFAVVWADPTVTITATCNACGDGSTVVFVGDGTAEDGFELTSQDATGSLAGFKFRSLD